MRLEIVEGRENLLIYVREPVLCTRLTLLRVAPCDTNTPESGTWVCSLACEKPMLALLRTLVLLRRFKEVLAADRYPV